MRDDRPRDDPPLRRGDKTVLDDPATFLRRLIMSEVLGPPVALRRKQRTRPRRPGCHKRGEV